MPTGVAIRDVHEQLSGAPAKSAAVRIMVNGSSAVSGQREMAR